MLTLQGFDGCPHCGRDSPSLWRRVLGTYFICRVCLCGGFGVFWCCYVVAEEERWEGVGMLMLDNKTYKRVVIKTKDEAKLR